ncbi:Regulatory protein uhpC [Raoultella terrigena]|nr:Regulatory protein uhpC [Raoultella terrigena]
MDVWHWSGFFVVITIAAGISALLLLPFFKRPGAENRQRSVTWLSFLPRVWQN